MVNHSLHDCSLHEVESLRAVMTDGRIAEVVIIDGRPEILRYVEDEAAQKAAKQMHQAAEQALDQMTGGDSKARAEFQARIQAALADQPQPYQPKTAPGDDPGSGAQGGMAKVERDGVFKAQLESVMNDNKFDRRLRGRTRGKLDLTRLYKAKTGSQSVFSQKALRRNKFYNVVLLVDESGSMNGPRKERASTMAQFLAQHFAEISGLDLAVLGFSGITYLHKDFGDDTPIPRLQQTIRRSGGGGTNDLVALRRAYRLIQGREGQPLVLFLTDGQGSSSGLTFPLIHRSGVPTIGIGIGIFPQQTPRAIAVDDLADLKPKIINILRQEIRRG